jgi:class 3 adenylate cyclase
MSSVMDQSNRTIIGSVVFVDIVGYSKKSVSEQITMKDKFTGLLSNSLKVIAHDQRIILDTGDGAALSFLGDPEDALFVGMNLRDLLRKASPNAPEPAEDATSTGADLFLRIGINLGPIKLVRDINGQPNIVGDGINVAQRIMSFARPGQVVVSRSYYDVVSVISDEYAQLFKYEGSRTDKHVREHEIYIVGESAAAFDKARAGMEDRAAATNPRVPAATAAAPPPSGTGGDAAGGTDASGETAIPFLQDKKKLGIVGGVLGLLVVVLGVLVASQKPATDASKVDTTQGATAPGATAAAVPALPAATSSPVPAEVTKAEAPAAPVAAPTTAAPTPAAVNPAAVAAPAAPAAKAEEKKVAVRTDPPKADAKVVDAKSDAAKAPAVQGTINLAIQPWGEVFVNGKSIGTTPPLKQHRLAPGKYKIEVRNTTFTPLLTNVEIKPREEVSIRHQFK